MTPPAHTTRDETAFDHVVVGAGLSGLAYAWRRRQAGRRVRVLERAPELAASPPALLVEPTPHLERLLEAVPGAPRLVPWAGGPLRIWTRAGLRLPDPLLRRLARRPGAWAEELRRRLARTPRAPDGPLQVLRGGDGAVRRALAAALGSAIVFGVQATRVVPSDHAGHTARVETDAGELLAREIVLDVAADEQARLLAQDAPHHADPLRVVPYDEEIRLVLQVPPRRLPPLAGIDRRVDAPGRIRSARFLSRLDPEAYPDGTVAVHVPAPTTSGVSAETIERIARVDLERALRVDLPCRVVAADTLRRPCPARGHRGRMAALAADLGGRGVHLLGAAAVGASLERLASPGVPVAGPLPDGVTIA